MSWACGFGMARLTHLADRVSSPRPPPALRPCAEETRQSRGRRRRQPRQAAPQTQEAAEVEEGSENICPGPTRSGG